MRKLLDDNLKNITISTTLVQFGNALVSVFIPLLLLQSGLKLADVCLFYIVYAVAKLIINYPAMLITNRWGARASLTLSTLSQAIYLIFLTAVVNGNLQLVWRIFLKVKPMAVCRLLSRRWIIRIKSGHRLSWLSLHAIIKKQLAHQVNFSIPTQAIYC